MRRSEEFIQRAEQMERSAEAALLPPEREGYLRIAEAYRRLAADVADLEGDLSNPPAAEPVVRGFGG